MITAIIFWTTVMILVFVYSKLVAKRHVKEIKAPILTEFEKQYLKKLKDSAAKVNAEEVNIDYKNPEPKDYKGKKLNPFIEDEIGQFDPRAGDWRVRKGLTSPDWIEFKGRNLELFNTRKLENEYLNKPFVGYRTVLTGDVLNGVLFVEGADDSVLKYSLCDNIPPDGRYVVHGVVEKRNVLNVTEYQAVEC